ncbi:hypothetical protein [Deferrisoma camini]|uniref:hypothetical protein n=1 Tax=Deferrisoma camini TaxID=1035120 RepID=UPI00146B6D06|nr:hypothetical protein [Deferrisoma camini]
MNELLKIVPTSWRWYLGFALVIPFAVRLFICWIESKRLSIPFKKIFKGFGGEENDKDVPADYWLAFIIGILEMLAYPPLIGSNTPEIIGGWLAFKTINRWQYAPNWSRGPFNRYLVANAVVLFGAYLSARFAFS